MSVIFGSSIPSAAGASGYQIERSLRFNSADSAHLTRTPASNGNLKTWTWSGWVKKNRNGTYQTLFGWIAASPSNQHYIDFDEFDTLRFTRYNGSNIGALQTTAVYRDVSAWYHIVAVWDTTQGTANNRMRLYVNGAEITAFSTRVNPSQNLDGVINSTVQHGIGQTVPYVANIADFMLADVYFIDGQALTPSDFGETDSTTGVWKPKAYSGTYGTNGFYLKFADNSAATATTLGKDSSGNGNNWTPNNLSVTAGAGNDSLVDTPTPYGTDTGAGGEVRGNYCTLNPVGRSYGTNAPLNGNLDVTGNLGYTRLMGTIKPSSGKWYWEYTVLHNSDGSGGNFVGITTTDSSSGTSGNRTYQVADAYAFFTGYSSLAQGLWTNGSETTNLGTSATSGEIIQFALDIDNNKLWIGKNGTWYSSGNPAAGTNALATITSSKAWVTFDEGYRSGTWNFGQRPFAYTAPSGFKALCTQNLPTPAVVQGDDHFNTVLYTGNGTTQSITGVGFSPDLVWMKSRSSGGSGSTNHVIVDAVRGAGSNGYKNLYPNLTDSEYDPSSGNESITALGSDGFTLGANANTNYNTMAAVAWSWDAGSSNVTNTQGSITSTVRANTTAGISVVTWTASGSYPNTTVGHGLGVTPAFIITKSRNNNNSWRIWHKNMSSANNEYYYLGFDTSAVGNFGSNYWVAPTSTIFGGQSSGYDNNVGNMVAYVFAPVAGFSAFGSYTGNGSADGPFVYLGFRPKYLLLKNVSTGSTAWIATDTSRSPYNECKDSLVPNSANAAETGANAWNLDILSNGFKIRNTFSSYNGSGNTIIYAAFAENPFKHALAR